jgi:hypothetical protein
MHDSRRGKLATCSQRGKEGGLMPEKMERFTLNPSCKTKKTNGNNNSK